MPKGALVVEIQCIRCMGTGLEIPDDLTNDPIIKCANCKLEIGPYSALESALKGEAHTVISGGVSKVTLKPIN